MTAFDRIRQDLWESRSRNVPHLDGLRGFASVMVVFYHCGLYMGLLNPANHALQDRYWWLLPVIKGCWSGIDIFFVLSGFLIGRILFIRLIKDGGLDYRKFIIRRSFRIFPAYYLTLLISLFGIAPLALDLWPFLYGTANWRELLLRSWSNFLYVSNYVNAGQGPDILTWGWSLCIEEHFYLILPPLLWAIMRLRSIKGQLLILSCGVWGPLLGRLVQYHLDPGIDLMRGFYQATHNRFDEIFWGVLLAYVFVTQYDRLKNVARRLGHGLWLMGCASYGTAWLLGGLFGQSAMHLVWQFTLLALGTSLLVVNGFFLDNRVARFFSHPIWYPLARISYGTYLLHTFVLFGMLNLVYHYTGSIQLAALPFFVFFVAGFGVSSALALILFELVERPLLDYGVRLNRRLEEPQTARTPVHQGAPGGQDIENAAVES